MDIERRKAGRIKKDLVVQFREFGYKKCWDIVQIKDIGELGLVMTTDKAFQTDTILHFRIKLPSNPFLWCEFDARVLECVKHQVRVEICAIEPEVKSMIHEYAAWFINKQQGKE